LVRVVAKQAGEPGCGIKNEGCRHPVMTFLLNRPIVFFLVTFALLWIAGLFGAYLRKFRSEPQKVDEGNFNLILGATLTLLGLIIGFSFSMAVSRYDQRKNYEEEEANAIGTEYVRVDILPTADAAKVRVLLRDYLDQRIIYYTSRDVELLRQTRAKTSQLQSNLWSAVIGPVNAQPSLISMLVLSGMNDVLNSEGYTEAAWRNRVPVAAWVLMISIAAFCNLLLGHHSHGKASTLLLVLPFALSISFFLIAEIDSPRSGTIRVHARNLEGLAESLRPH